MRNDLKTLVGSIQKFSTEDGPGIRTTVFLKGCPLNCKWCHNPEMIRVGQEIIISANKCIGCGFCTNVCPQGGISLGDKGPVIDRDKCTACGKCADECYTNAIRCVAEEMSVEDVLHIVMQDIDYYGKSGGVTISGGEVLIHGAFAAELIKKCAENDIRVCVDTSGYSDYETLRALVANDNVDYVLYDMKHIDSIRHKEYTGVSNERILANLEAMAADDTLKNKIWMRMPLVSGVNDDEDTIRQTAKLYCRLGLSRVTLMAYHDFGNSKAERVGGHLDNFEAPSDDRMAEIKTCLEAVGMAVEISGKDELII